MPVGCRDRWGHFLVDVHQRRRRRYPGLYRKTQTMGLAGAMVGILAEDYDFYTVERSAVQGGEDFTPLEGIWSFLPAFPA